MLPTKNDDIQVQNNLDGERIAMKFDENSLAHIMSVLTDLYSDPELAVIREYSTNALDAQIEAGVTRPIEVQTPGPLSPYFKVKDYGVGLSVDDISNIYSKYGASTKRETNTQVGMLGLGCKSALTYTSQFNVISVKNGIKVHVSVSRVEDGTGVMEVVDTKSTTEPNGTEVIVPVKAYNTFESKAKNFFQFWAEGTVLVNGQEPKRVSGTKVGDNIVVSQELGEDYIVMGNVAYPVERRLYTGYYRYFGIVAYVPIGSVNFTPSREQLHFTTLTNTTIERINKEFTEGIGKAISDDIASAGSKSEALKRYLAWPDSLIKAATSVTYKSLEIPKSFTGDFTIYEPNRARYSTQHAGRIDHRSIKNAIIVHGYTSDNLTARNKQKARIWMEENNKNYNTLIFSPIFPGEGWLDDHAAVAWADIAAVKIETSSTPTAKKVRNKYDVYQSDGTIRNTDTFDTSKEVYYFSPTDDVNFGGMGTVVKHFPDAIIVLLNKNRWAKFNRDFPGAKHLRELVRPEVARLVASVSKMDKMVMRATWSDQRLSTSLPLDKIADPNLREYLTALRDAKKNGGGTSANYNKASTLARIVGIGCPALDYSGISESPTGRYPLLAASTTRSDHYLLYVNAVYASTLDAF